MSEETVPFCCAFCSVAVCDAAKWKECDGCDLVKYCSDDCQRYHRPLHLEECRKRAAVLRDDILFKQPEGTHIGDCPICCLPIPIDGADKSRMMGCCSKVICNGCDSASKKRDYQTCAFCRESIPETEEECDKKRMKRVEANDPAALCQEGYKHHEKGDYQSAFDYWTKAAELGNVGAHFELACLYDDGDGVAPDQGKYTHHLKVAAIGGHPGARYNLGIHEWNNYNIKRAMKHWVIAAAQGDDLSIKMLLEKYSISEGCVSKEDLAAALRAHKAAVDATKSPQRDEAEEFYRINPDLIRF